MPADLMLRPLKGGERTLNSHLSMFSLVTVVLDPYTHESAWVLDAATRTLRHFSAADVRPAWVVTADEYDTKAFLGPLADELLTFVDPEATFAKAAGADSLPALVHVNMRCEVEGIACGWNPPEWREVIDGLAKAMAWSPIATPQIGDPVAFEGTPIPA